MKDNIGISFGIQGMERQNFQHLIDDKIFTFQRNGNLETDENSIGLTNEHSNLLCSRFKPNYKVIGHKVDILNNIIYFFLTNVESGISEIGSIKLNKNIDDIDDILVSCGCNKKLEFGESLENINQSEYCKYTTLISDECNKCLNFNINYPIRDVEIKHEVLGSMLVFTDGHNPPRYINLNELDSYREVRSVNNVLEYSTPTFYKPLLNKKVTKCPDGYLTKNGECVIEEELRCEDGYSYNRKNGLCEKIGIGKTDIHLILNKSASVYDDDMESQKNLALNLLSSIKNELDSKQIRVLISIYNNNCKILTNDYISNYTSLVELINNNLNTRGTGDSNMNESLMTNVNFAKLNSKNNVKFILFTTGSNILSVEKGDSLYKTDFKLKYPSVKNYVNAIGNYCRNDLNYNISVISMGNDIDKNDFSNYHSIKDYNGNYLASLNNDNSININYLDGSFVSKFNDSLIITESTQPYCENGVRNGDICEIKLHKDDEVLHPYCNTGDLYRESDLDYTIPEGNKIYFNDECYTCMNIVKGVKECDCDDCFEEICLDCDKLRIFPIFETPNIAVDSVQFGGRLKMGTYEFAVAYCDKLGIERTSYYSFTNKIKIFDEDLAKIGDKSNDGTTNYAIKLLLNSLDKRFSYYKIMYIHVDAVTATTTVYEEGVHPISESELLITSVDNAKPSTMNKLHAQKPTYNKWGGLAVANNYLFGYDYEIEEEWNLQPIGVLMGSLMQWQSNYATESFYKDGAVNEEYGGYMRDEIYPLSFRIHTDYGYTSPNINLVGRPANSNELEDVTIEEEVQSIHEGVEGCIGNNRTKRWQFYNTAKETGYCDDYNLTNGEIVNKEFQITCAVDEEPLRNGVFELFLDGRFKNLRTYVEDYFDEICSPKSEYYNPNLCSIFSTDFGGSCQPALPYKVDESLDYNFCDVPEPIEMDNGQYFTNEIASIVGEVRDYTKKELDEYIRTKKPTYCSISESSDYVSSFDKEALYRMLLNGGVDEEDVIYIINSPDEEMDDCANTDYIVYNTKIIRKNFTPYNNCSTAFDLSTSNELYFIHELYDTYEELFSKVESVAFPGFDKRIAENSKWFVIDFEEEDSKILEITKGSRDFNYKDDTVGDNIVRVSIFNACSSRRELKESFLVDLKEGFFKEYFKEDFLLQKKMYIAIDTPPIEIRNVKKWSTKRGNCRKDYKQVPLYTVASTNYCASILSRNIEYKHLSLKYDELHIQKSSMFSTNCTFLKPKLNRCEALPYKTGEFSYWESTEEYPNNKELYNASNLKIHIDDIPDEYRSNFEKYFKSKLTSDNYYILNDNADVTCKPIRHFKFPDNTVAPFMEYENNYDPFSESRVFPLGFRFDPNLINSFLDIAVKNEMITQKQRDSITDIEFFRGDRRINKSILYKGIANDFYKDTSKKDTYFRNFPYNTLGRNFLLSEDKERNIPIDHPYSSRGNTRLSLVAPELYYNTQNIYPTEVSVEGYMYGSSFGSYKEVEEHSKWVILGSKLTRLAKRLALLETAVDIAMGGQMLADSFNGARIGLTNNPTTPGAIALGAIAQTTSITGQIATSGKHIITWINSFKDMGNPINFASMYISPKGYYNTFIPNTKSGNKIRGLRNNKLLKPGQVMINEGGKVIQINNKDRETSLYLYFGEDYMLNYPSEYISYDNASVNAGKSSRYVASRVSDDYGVESTRNIASPYISVKNFLPSQYGGIDSIKWLSTGSKIKIKNQKLCKTIFGGDIVISRMKFKNKFPFFTNTAMKLANRTPIKYSLYSNVAHSTYYCDYDTEETSVGISDLPILDSTYKFDGFKNRDKRYVMEPAKFFLYSYGIIDFLVESEINGHFRYHGIEPHEQHADLVDVYDWVQEKNTTIAYNNTFYYNRIFSEPQNYPPTRILSSVYNKSDYSKLCKIPNGVIYSQPDNSEISLDNPWLTFKPYDETLFKTSYGKLIQLKSIESEQVLGLFENNAVIFNAVDTLRDRINPDNESLGTGGIFATRPSEFTHSELGDNGTQHKSIVSTEFGHFIVDSKRGKINQILPNAKGISVISDLKAEGGESGMRKWFKRHLPFKINKYDIEGLKDTDTDNTFKGIGILMWWDSVYKRLFVTKKDYIPKVDNIKFSKDIGFYVSDYTSPICREGWKYDESKDICTRFISDIIEVEKPTYRRIEISVKDDKYFKDVSWTLSYSALYQSWVSYHDFIPDYAIGLPDYFQTGLNYASDKKVGVWSHLLTNKSYQVYYGEKFPWEIEIPIKNTYTGNYLKDIKIWAESKKYTNDYDFSLVRNNSFNKAIIYNNTNNSGELILNYSDSLNKGGFPKKVDGNPTSQEIVVTHTDGSIKMNYFYNRVKDNSNNINIWEWDDNEIYKSLNKNAISFTSKRVLERLRGDWFTVRLIQDKSSQYKQMFKWMLYTEKSY